MQATKNSLKREFQSVEKPIFTILCGDKTHFVFLATCAAEKLLISENRLFSGFQGHVGGIGGSGVQYENFLILVERHSRQESVDFIDTLKLPKKGVFIIMLLPLLFSLYVFSK